MLDLRDDVDLDVGIHIGFVVDIAGQYSYMTLVIHVVPGIRTLQRIPSEQF